MTQLTSKELLYLEDMSRMFDNIVKTCDLTSSVTADPQLKTLMQNLSEDHRQWITSTSSLVGSTNIQ